MQIMSGFILKDSFVKKFLSGIIPLWFSHLICQLYNYAELYVPILHLVK